MDWFYALNGEQRGPVTDAQLDELIRAGTLAPDTLVWRDGMTDWKPFSDARPAATSGSLPPVISAPITQTGTRCVECDHSYAQSDMIVLNNSWVCATCKPKFLQRMMEGGTAPMNSRLMWRRKKEIVLGPDTPFPDRCLCCNEPTNGFKLKRDLSWHPQAYFLLVLLSPLIYVIVAMIVRKKATLHIGLCEAHRIARKRAILFCSLGAVLGFLSIIAAAIIESGILALVGVVLILGSIIYAAMKVPTISATKIENNLVWFKGAGKPFLETLPEWNGR